MCFGLDLMEEEGERRSSQAIDPLVHFLVGNVKLELRPFVWNMCWIVGQYDVCVLIQEVQEKMQVETMFPLNSHEPCQMRI